MTEQATGGGIRRAKSKSRRFLSVDHVRAMNVHASVTIWRKKLSTNSKLFLTSFAGRFHKGNSKPISGGAWLLILLMNVAVSNMANNGDTKRKFKVGKDHVCGLGSFHKTLKHNKYGEVDECDFNRLVDATEGLAPFSTVPRFADGTARLTNPQAGLARDRLTRDPSDYSMPPAPTVLSTSTAAEMVELYWMALLRDVSLIDLETFGMTSQAANEIGTWFSKAVSDDKDPGHLRPGTDLPGSSKTMDKITAKNLFRIGLPGEEFGPLVSQFFVRDVPFGTQKIDQRNRPYKSNKNFLTDFDDWLVAQNTGQDCDGLDYPKSNEKSEAFFEKTPRYIGSLRDLARFVNKDALHQAYFNAALLMLSGGAKWNQGNPYGDFGPPEFGNREAGFGVLGGPHILALVSEVATRALKIVWHQKWQVHLRLRPEAYGGLAHVQSIGIGSKKEKRAYGLPPQLFTTHAAKEIMQCNHSLLLPMAFTAGSPTHAAYGAGHATVAGACVTVLKAFFQTFKRDADGNIIPLPLLTLNERLEPYLPPSPFRAIITGKDEGENGICKELPASIAEKLTIEGELNKLASNVAMGRSMGGVHWRSDNTRSLVLGETIAAQILADITLDSHERPYFEFRSFERDASGNPRLITIRQGQIRVNGELKSSTAMS